MFHTLWRRKAPHFPRAWPRCIDGMGHSCSLPPQVLFSLVSHHCHLRNPLVALQWLNAIAIEMPSPAVFCAAAHLLLQASAVSRLFSA